ncbi:GH12896 [Drosophila grimshawi]|nr:GH12896 [Drosophila grimshawi]
MATAGDSTNKIILPQILNGNVDSGSNSGFGASGTSSAKHNSGTNKSAAPATGNGGATANGNTVLGSNGIIVAGGVPNVPTSNLNV